MPKTRAQLEEALRLFESNLPTFAEVTDPLADVSIFALAEAIFADASPRDQEFVRDRITCLLGSVGVIPSDNEGQSCG